MSNIEILEFPHSCVGLDYKTFSSELVPNVKIGEYESGTTTRRARNCQMKRNISVTYITCSKEGRDCLDDFFKNKTFGFVKSFLWIEPCSQKKIRVNFQSNIRFKVLDPCFENFEVTFNLQQLCDIE